MESSSVGIESIEKVSWKEAMAKKVLLKLLSKIEQGSLTLQEADETHQFGNPNSDIKAHVTVNDQKLYWNMLTGGTIAAGECYFNGLWDSPDVTKVIRVMVRNSDLMDTIDHRFSGLSQLIQRFSHFSNRNSKSQSKKNIVAHYDLGNDFYKLFLDETMMYSSAAGSMSPERVPIIRPSSGVRPMVVSTDCPSRIAAMEAPLPRWQVIKLVWSMGSPSRLTAS